MKAIIEIHEGSNNKTEIKDGVATVDRVLERRLPVNYGFIDGTLAEDGDPLDVFVLSHKFLYTSDEAEVKVLGVFDCTDQGVTDNKLFAVLTDEKIDESYIFKKLVEVGDFLMNYKEGFKVLGYRPLKSLDEIEKYKV
jgi:inorganic pyrophosphatase